MALRRATQSVVLRPQALLSRPVVPLFLQQRGMATEAQIKARMHTVKNIQKITKAMKLVSAAKLRSTQQQLDIVRNFSAGIIQVWPEVEGAQKTLEGAVLVVPISSDRGLCGSANSTIARRTKAHIAELLSQKVPVAIATMGMKSKSALERLYASSFQFDMAEGYKTKVFHFKQACMVQDILNTIKWGRMDIVHNWFKNLLTFDTKILSLYSFDSQATKLNTLFGGKYEVEDGGYTVQLFRNMHEFRSAVALFSCFQENLTSEMSARMNAMSSSTKAAGEMGTALQLIYNRTRQQRITTELIEIISGTVALADKKE
jgi:ATP synthase F1 gamma subunit